MESVVQDPQSWDITVIRAQGLRLMRPEKAWRPIVTVEVDRATPYEMVLGVDGQNPNLKQGYRLYDVKESSTIEFKLLHQSQSKKKSKKKILVASASHTLADLRKRLEAASGLSPEAAGTAASRGRAMRPGGIVVAVRARRWRGLAPRGELLSRPPSHRHLLVDVGDASLYLSEVNSFQPTNYVTLGTSSPACQYPQTHITPYASKRSNRNYVDLRLSCQSASRRPASSPTSSAARGRPQNGAYLTVKIVPPPLPSSAGSRRMETEEEERSLPVGHGTYEEARYSSDDGSHSSSSSAHPRSPTASVSRSSSLSRQYASISPTLIDIHPPSPRVSPTQLSPPPPGLSLDPNSGIRRRRTRRRKKQGSVKGYSLFSDEDPPAASGSSSYSEYSEAESLSSLASGSRLSGSGLDTVVNSSSTSFFGAPVRSKPLDSCFDEYSDSEVFELKGVGAGDADVPRVIEVSFGSAEETTTVKKSAGEETHSKRMSVTRWIAASLLPQHILSHPTASAAPPPASSSKSKTQVDVEEVEFDEEEGEFEDEIEEVPPYTETDITLAPTPSRNPSARIKKGRATKAVLASSSKPTSKKSSPSKKPTSGTADAPQRDAWWETLLSNITLYHPLRHATHDAHFDAILAQLRMEWTFMGGFLAALGAVDVAVLAIDGEAPLIPLTALALKCIALSSTFTGLGLCALAYFVLRYSLLSAETFQRRARDVYGTYVFFALSARLPTLCMVVSAVGVMAFLALVAFEVWPQGVVVGCGLVGVVMSLQFLVYGVHMCARGVVGVGRGVVRVVGGRVVRASTRTERPVAGV